mmetsp:Transcript_35528/g.81378  ORF Transcript_35528/g.81378 Transcript_35528/m.81378 type:complete len:225 (+) Transcript_35528:766-1440(+)
MPSTDAHAENFGMSSLAAWMVVATRVQYAVAAMRHLAPRLHGMVTVEEGLVFQPEQSCSGVQMTSETLVATLVTALQMRWLGKGSVQAVMAAHIALLARAMDEYTLCCWSRYLVVCSGMTGESGSSSQHALGAKMCERYQLRNWRGEAAPLPSCRQPHKWQALAFAVNSLHLAQLGLQSSWKYPAHPLRQRQSQFARWCFHWPEPSSHLCHLHVDLEPQARSQL